MNERAQSAAGPIAVVVLVGAVILVGVGLASMQTVDEGHVKVVTYKGNAEGTFYPGNWYFINPITQGTVSVDVRPQVMQMVAAQGEGERSEFDDSIKVVTNDNMRVPVDVAITYQVDDPVTFYEEWKTHDQARQRAIRPGSRAAIYTVGGGMSGTEITNDEARERMRLAVAEELEDRFDGTGLALIAVDIRGVYPPDSFLDAAENAQAERQEIIAEQHRQEVAREHAETLRIEAEGERDARLIRAEAYENDAVLEAMYIDELSESNVIYVPVGNDGVPLFMDVSDDENSTSGSP